MKHRNRPDDLDRILAAEGSEHVALRELLTHLRSALPTEPAESTADRHLAELTQVAAEHAHEEPVTTAAAAWRRRVAHVLGYTATKVALGVGVAAAATGGLAATESLPDPVQRAVSTGASYIGVDFPYPEDLLDELGTPVEELPSPDTGAPQDEPADDRSDSTRGAEVDAPADDAPPVDEPAGENAPVEEAPPVDAPPDGEEDVPPAHQDDRPSPPVDAPPAEPPVQDDTSGGDGMKASSTDDGELRP